MDQADRELIDKLYVVFARYERPESFEGWPCGGCWGGLADQIGLHPSGHVVVPAPGGKRPLPTLTESDVGNVVETVPGTSGDLTVYRHYLPRILEILAEGGWEDWPEAEDVIRRLHEAEPPWRDWPSAESDAVSWFLERFGWPASLADLAEDE